MRRPTENYVSDLHSGFVLKLLSDDIGAVQRAHAQA